MTRTLYGRMAAVLLGLLVFLGVVYVAVAVHSNRRYEQEVTQRLNRGLASHLVAEDVLLVDGEVNEAALEHVFHTLMVINPAIEVYLLDLDGAIITYSAPAGHVKRRRVDTGPIEAFLAGDQRLPILGDDPRALGRRKVFSASPIMVGDRYEGYLYVVLAGEQYDSVAQVLRGNHILRLGLSVVGGALVVALLAGLGMFNMLTRPLRRLTSTVERFRSGDFSDPAAIPAASGGDDEVSRLETAVALMGERIIQQVRALRQTDELRRELVANVSHDLRTPLSSLQGYLETVVLKGEELKEAERRRYLAIAASHGDRLRRLVDELFELARLESPEMEPEVEPFPLAELVQDVVQEFRLEAADKGVRLAARLPEDLPLAAADIALIQRVLQNLVANAIKHTEEGGSVEVILEACGGEAVSVRVEDTGCGIPAEQLVRVFDRFYQVPRPDVAAGGPRGGLGLAIVKRILQLHGSSIEAASTLGHGTTFRFSLPAMP